MKVEFDTFFKFVQDYEQGSYFLQRLGQAFINTHMRSVTDPSLFYEECPVKAEKMILETYVELAQ